MGFHAFLCSVYDRTQPYGSDLQLLIRAVPESRLSLLRRCVLPGQADGVDFFGCWLVRVIPVLAGPGEMADILRR